MSLENLRVDVKFLHKHDGDPCVNCGRPIRENHDNFECVYCKYADFDNYNIPRTGVLVRAKRYDGKGYCNADIAELDDESLATWVFERLDELGKLNLIRILLGRKPGV